MILVRVDMGPEASVPEGGARCVTLDGTTYALFKIRGHVYCVDNRCPHQGGPLCEGQLRRFIVECPWHGSRFDARTGRLIRIPARGPVRSYPVVIDGGEVWVELA